MNWDILIDLLFGDLVVVVGKELQNLEQGLVVKVSPGVVLFLSESILVIQHLKIK